MTTGVKTSSDLSKLFLPVNFWSTILASLDSKVQALSESYGFGEVSLKLIIHRGKVTEIYFNDEVRIRGLVEQFDKPEKKNLTIPTNV